jgi:hypothetical protein
MIGCIEDPEEPFVRAITLLIVGALIATLGSAAVVLYAFRWLARDSCSGSASSLFSTGSPSSSGIPPFVGASDNRRVSDFLLSGS